MPRRILYIIALVILVGLVCTKCVTQMRSQPSTSEPAPVGIAPGMTVAELEAKGDALRKQKAYAEALAHYRAALAKDKMNSVLFNKAGIAELQLGQLATAQKDFERAAKRNRNYAEAYNNLGVIAYMRKDYKKAIKQYQRALALRDNSAPFHSNLGATYFAQKKMENAMVEYRRALELDPDILLRSSAGGVAAQIASPEDRAHYWYVLAKMYAQRDDCDRCVHCLRKAQEEGYRKLQDVNKEPAFAAVRQDPRVVELLTPKSRE
jgi:tetratricopeptide (TPR) repeat protein